MLRRLLPGGVRPNPWKLLMTHPEGPLVECSAPTVDALDRNLAHYQMPFVDLIDADSNRLGVVVVTPAMVWVIDLSAASAFTKRHLVEQAAQVVGSCVAGVVDVQVARLRDRSDREEVEPDGTIRASVAQVVARWLTPGSLTQDQAATLVSIVAARLEVG